MIKFRRSKIDTDLDLWVAIFAEFCRWSKKQTIKWAHESGLVDVNNEIRRHYEHPQDVALRFICWRLLLGKLQSVPDDVATDIVANVKKRVAELNRYIPDYRKINLKWYHAEVDEILSEYR